MDDDASCDVIFVGSDGSQTYGEYPDRPIVKLFEKLIGNDTKQNTVLTNAQIINILNKEFDVDVENTELLEIEIFINVIKKYLKDWPDWDKFEKDIINLESQKNKDVKKIIDINYLALKKYLQSKLDIVKVLLPKYLKEVSQTKIVKKLEIKNLDLKNPDEKIVMEVLSTKAQLNNLILRQPNFKNSIFNSKEPQHEQCQIMPLKAILNWGGVNIIAKVTWSQTEMLLFKYENNHKSKFTLVNKKLPIQTNKTKHIMEWQMKCKNLKANISIEDFLNLILTYSKQGMPWNSVFEIIYDNLRVLTKDIPSSIDLPVEFKKHLSRYSFVRYMYKENDSIAENDGNFDLQLEEMITPICYMHLDIHKTKDLKDYIRFECNVCQMEFIGNDVFTIEKHFTMYHIMEPDWQCINCDAQISPSELAFMNWQHKCPFGDKLLQALKR